MKVKSPAGEFEITLEEADVEEGRVVVRGRMGVWDSKIYMEPHELAAFLVIMLKPKVLLFLLSLPFRFAFNVIFGSDKSDKENGG